MKQVLFGKMRDAFDEIDGAAVEVVDISLLVKSLEEQLEAEVEQLIEEPRMVKIFVERYPMYAAIIRTIRNSLDRQIMAINTGSETATALLQEIEAAANNHAAFHAGYEAGKEAGKQADPQG